MSAVVLRDVHKSFGRNHVLRGVNLNVAQHEVVGLIGASGSGKSTLLRCINALETITSGTITVGTTEVSSPHTDVDQLRQRIGIVFQSFNLFPHLSVLDNCTLAPIKLKRMSIDQARSAAHEQLGKLGLRDKASAFPDRLSGGQQQRVAIARALMMNPEVMLFDEVTSALDPVLVGEVLSTIKELAANGMTMLLATHEMTFCQEVATQVAFLKDGQVCEVGTPAKLFTNPQHPDTQQFLQRVIAAGRL
jgi:polar amino acid transport system ATP-binding protein